jgi:signal transduction histidine kinase
MKFLPRTLFGQILLALCAGLLAAQVAGIWLTLSDRAKFGEGLMGSFAAQRIAGVISILDKAEPTERQRLVRALNVPPTHISIDEPWKTAIDVPTDDAKSFIEHVAQEVDRPVAIQVLAIRQFDPRRRGDSTAPGTLNNRSADFRLTPPPSPKLSDTSADASEPDSKGDIKPTSDGERRRRFRPNRPFSFLIGQARLADGTVLTFRHGLPETGIEGPLRLLGMLAILGVSVALLSAWAVRRLTQPLASLADAATGLAQNLEQPPLPENGPTEIAQAARAFNAMQRDIRRYLDTRAHALAAVSHDLRLPITRLRLRLEKIEEGELRGKMENDLTEMDQMIGSTLEFLRAGSTAEKASRLDLNALVESVTEDMITVGATIRQHGSVAQPMLVRPQALRRCLTNLLENARRYGGGDVDISLSEKEGAVEIRVDDRGPGIPKDDLERVFEPFVRIESSRAKQTGGSGLGLAIARAIARSHSGDVRLEPRDGGGISAILILPRNIAAA